MQGEIWLYEMPEDKARPVLVVTRDITALGKVVVAPITSTIRGVGSELAVGPENGLDHDSVAVFDNLMTVAKPDLSHRIGGQVVEHHFICDALAALADC